jgi:hypothetical protein
MSDFIESRKGFSQLVKDGYVYRCRKTYKNIKYWSCITSGCKGKITEKPGVIMEIKQEHDHAPDDLNVEMRKVVTSMKKRARTETTPIPTIYKESLTEFLDAGLNFVTSSVATYDHVKSSLYRNRHQAMGIETLPNTAEDINLTGKWTETKAGMLLQK